MGRMRAAECYWWAESHIWGWGRVGIAFLFLDPDLLLDNEEAAVTRRAFVQVQLVSQQWPFLARHFGAWLPLDKFIAM